MPFIPDPNNPGGPFIEITQAEYDIWVQNVVSRNSAVNEQQAVELQEVPPPQDLPGVTEIDTAPNNVGYTTAFDPETDSYSVVNQETGLPVNSGLTEQQALLQAQEQTFIDAGEEPSRPVADTGQVAKPPNSLTAAQLDAIAAAQGVDAGDGGDIPESALYRNETAAQNPYNTLGIDQGGFTGPLFDTASSRESIDQALRDQARQQQTISQQRAQINNSDWRVRLRLAPGAKYLYNAPNPGILQPLKVTDGVIFPYTPKIDTAYKADYDPYTLTHSNYKGYFYKGSYVDTINLTATFTAQSTAEANYLLAVITFFKSATKMFYGQDAERGAPPPLVYLSGLGEYQFNEHPCVLNQFNFNLPSEVDYVRAGNINNRGQNLVNQRDRQNVATASNFGGLNRLAAAFLTKGALPNVPAPGSLSINRPTYVPTKMDITISLLPIQSRKQVSKQFSLKEFANGNLIKGGFW